MPATSAFADDQRAMHGIEPIRKILPIVPSTYHAHVAVRTDAGRVPDRTRRDLQIRGEIREIFDLNFGVWGVRRV